MLMTSTRYTIHPPRVKEFEQVAARIAKAAADDDRTHRWSTYQTRSGELGTYYFGIRSENWAGQAKLEPPDAMTVRLLGKKDGELLVEQVLACVVHAQQTISEDRPDLSYPSPDQGPAPLLLATRLRARPGGEEEVEEVLRKLGEAVPKVDDPRRFVTFQHVIGDFATYVTIAPLRDVGELDRMLLPVELLTRAFGAAEGGLIARQGLQAIQHGQRELLILRPELSHLV
jgi:hypothetical protein